MKANTFTATLAKTGFVASILLLASGAAFAQSVVNLTAGPVNAVLPDGQSVPMWGYSCTGTPTSATCAAANPNAGANWSPVVITVPYNTSGPTTLTINLTNNLSFGAGGANKIPTSLVIVGQLGGGLGGAPTRTPSPVHASQGATWPASAPPTVNCATTSAADAAAAGENCPPAQPDRVQSFATEVAAAGATLTTGQVASGSALTWNNLRPGTYLIHSGTHPSIQSPMGLYGMLVVTTAPVTGATPARGIAYSTPLVNYDAEVPMLLSEIDSVQNAAVAAAVATAGFSETKVWSGQPGQCGDLPPSATSVAAEANTCYPPAINYDPRYYLINGVSFDRTNVPGSLFAPAPAVGTGTVLARFVNAGLRMHVPSIVGALTGSAVPGFSLVAEDGNVLPGVPKVQTHVFLAAGKTYDVLMNASAPALPVYDRSLSLSTNNQRDGGMQGYIGATAPTVGTTLSGASGKTYFCVDGVTLDASNPAKGVLAGATGANGAALGTAFTGAVNASNLAFQSNGTFIYTPPASGSCAGSFNFFVNGGSTSLTATISHCGDSGSGCALGGPPIANTDVYSSTISVRLQVSPPGVLLNDTDPSKLPLTAAIVPGSVTGGMVTLNADGSFTAVPGIIGSTGFITATGTLTSTLTFAYNAVNSQKSTSVSPASVTVTFPGSSGLAVNVVDAKTKLAINDYRWIIEEDRTFYIDPKCQINTSAARLDSNGRACPALPVESLGYNFHTANMPVVASGCVGAVSCEAGQTLVDPDTQQHNAAVCDVGNGACRLGAQKAETLPGQVVLDPTKRYFISVLPGDGVNPVLGGAGGAMQVDPACDPTAGTCKMRQFDIVKDCGDYTGPTGAWEPGGAGALCGHAMGGMSIPVANSATNIRPPINISLQRTPLPTSKIAVFVFEDDFPLNGENDAGGGVDVIAPNEPGLGGFEIKVFDQAGGLGDATGQITYDMFNMPVSNSLAGFIDPVTGLDSCPIAKNGAGNIVGMIPTCPRFESDGTTQSPLAGQAVIANLYPGLYEIVATPAADRIARGEEWLQTNTLDGGKAHEAFIKPNEPGYFQEFGPGGFHVSIGFANPKIINDRKAALCVGQDCSATLKVQIAATRMSRTPDQRIYSSGSYDAYGFTQCYVSVGPQDGADFAFEKCGPDGTATFTGMPVGDFKLTVFDQWNDLMLDGLVSPVHIGGSDTLEFPVTQWRTNLYTRTFLDQNGDGVSQDSEPGLPLVSTNIRYRDGSFGFFNNTDLNGYAGFNEVFPFMNWLVVETSTTRYKVTGVHSVYDAGGPADGTPGGGTSAIAAGLANSIEHNSLPVALRVPGARYCASADCPLGDDVGTATTGLSTGRVDPPWVGATQGWQGLLGQNSFIEWAMAPFASGENGGIMGHVIYASTRPFDDPALLLQLSWEPGVPRVKINLYQEGTAADGTTTLLLVDNTTSSSWDDWAQGFRTDGNPNMNCPGQDGTSPFFQTLKNSKQWLDPAKTPLPNNSQFKCYDGWSMLNQIQPAPYDGMYKFPSVTSINPTTGKPAGTNCTGCTTNPADGTPMLPPGKYVVEVIVPPGFELVKEEDKNILLGDVYIAPIDSQFAGLGNIFIMPDQAAINAFYNKNNGINPTTNFGLPRHEGDTGSIETFWPCVGATRIVPDFNSLYPTSGQNAPFAGAKRPLCDRKEVTLKDEMTALAKFYIFSSTHIAGHFTGSITNDFASEFDPFSPQFGEKFGPPNLPVSMRDFEGNEVVRVYSDQWGLYNGLYFSSYGVNPPNPTGYVPQMSIACMNDPGPIAKTNALGQYVDANNVVVASADLAAKIVDPSYSPAYSNYCYETPFMPGFTAYMDTPVIPTMGFADGYNLPDSEYPDGTPAIKSVVSTAGAGPWVQPATTAAAATATITFSSVSSGDVVTSVAAGTTVLTSGPIACNTANACGNLTSGTARNNRMALLVAQQIVASSGTTGITVNPLPTGSTVTLTATATGIALNGTAVTVSSTGITVGGTLAFAGGAVTAPAAMGLTITALGDRVVQNPNYSGPNAPTEPFNQKTITRRYSFGGTAGTVALVGSDNVVRPLTGVSWSDTQITGTVPSGLPNCTVQQRGQPVAQCGQLVITRGGTDANAGKRSIDAITVTVGGKAPTFVAPAAATDPVVAGPFGRILASPLQTAIDNASPGDLIVVAPGTYRENLIMWKPVRLQGVGADSVVINADAHPAGKMDSWRRQVACLFGLTINGVPNPGNAAYDPSSTYSCPATMFMKVDRIPFESIAGWDAAGNGNLAQVLQEPTLMGAYEGAGITVLGRGINVGTSTDYWGQGTPGVPGAFPDGSRYLRNSAADCATTLTGGRLETDYGTGNFQCNPSRIDGVSVINSSQGGGGIFEHGWNHLMEIANNRIYGNHGTLAGAINLGNGEAPPIFVNDGTICGAGTTPLCPPFGTGGSLIGTLTVAANATIPSQLNVLNRIHHNMIINNASIGDALFSGTPSGAGGINISLGSDNYTIDHNWIAGNLSSGDGAGIGHQGVIFNGAIRNNWILFNQSTNPTLPTNGGGVLIAGASADRTLPNGLECGSVVDVDCPPGIGDGAGQGTVIDANLIMGNSAESGSGGGLRLQQINGSEVSTFNLNNAQWYGVTVTNNIIANNVAGWDGGGVSMQDALKVTLVNNTIVSNDTTASAGALFKTLGAINSSAPPPGCVPTPDPLFPQNTLCLNPNAPHGPQPAGLVTMANTPNLVESMPGVVVCPSGYGYSILTQECKTLSKPALANNMLWQNRSFRVDIVGPGSDIQSQQNIIALTPLLNQAATGQCPGGAMYWDIGIRTDDIAAGTIPSTASLSMANSIFSVAPGVTGNNNFTPGGSPVIAQYCNGSRVAPESGRLSGFNVDPGRSETTGLSPVFVFNNITPAATVDEGHNWLNLTYGPLTLNRSAVQSASTNPPELMVASAATGTAGGAYSIAGTSAAVNRGSNTAVNGVAPTTDFFGNTRARSTANPVDIGAVEYQVVSSTTPQVAANPNPLRFTDVVAGSGTATRDLVLTNIGTATFTIPAQTFSAGFTRVATGATPSPAFCGTTLTAGNSCTIRVSWNAVPATATATATAVVTAGAITAINVGTAGSAYTSAPTVLLIGGGGIGASAHAVLTGGAVSSIVVDTGGSGYTSAPAVALSGGDRPIGTVTIAGVSGSPVSIVGNTLAPLARALVSPSPLAFGNWATGTNNTMTLTVTNVGNVALAGGTFTFGGGTPQPFSRPAAGGTCTAALAVGASCTINVVFAPATAAAFSRTLTVAYTGTTVEPTPVQLTGTGVAARATVSFAPLTITLMPGTTTDISALTVTNSAPVGTGASMTITAVGNPVGGSLTTYFFNKVLTADACTGHTLPPGGSCTVGIRFTNVGSPRGVNRTATISVTSNGTPSPAIGTLNGIAMP